MSTLQIEERISVNAPAGRVWKFMLDPARVAACLPGAKLDGTEGDDTFLGTMKVKVGPVLMEIKGKATMSDIDPVERRVTMSGTGNDKAGGGSARMDMKSQVLEKDGGSEIVVTAEVHLAGKLVRFGRGMMEGISKQLFKQFAERVHTALDQDDDDGEEEDEALDETEPSPAPAKPEAPESLAAEAKPAAPPPKKETPPAAAEEKASAEEPPAEPADRASPEKTPAEKAAAETAAPEEAPAEKAAAETVVPEKAPDEKAAAESPSPEKAPAEKAAVTASLEAGSPEEAAADTAAPENASAQEAPAEKASPDDKAPAEKASADDKAPAAAKPKVAQGGTASTVAATPAALRKKKAAPKKAIVPAEDNAPLDAGSLVWAAIWAWIKGLFSRLFGKSKD